MVLEEYMLPCLSKSLFGIECFGCGMQRSVVMVFQGRFLDAWKLFPAVYPFFFFAAFLAIDYFDKSKSYGKMIIISAVIMSFTMVISYFFRHPLF
ncbi:DUF2752 domain-containing protein [Frigoriflavimonas asaccharolytica]|uniref:DUF2752 domain-containing protein n=1 Tax=Frigoriflavimonas asaccharolytica TaxID=2735899 RepID=A0A8J8GCA0_9FLAO|nr:DUF2752 domain-containing protein [Frigoriflavimonas asaccharolytica]NRS93082.1 hypothetical protein [Frigoriflavimonas asaccharolytica]